MASPEHIVREFCDAVSKRDPELLRPLLADDIVYRNVGMPASKGIDDVLANLGGQWAMFPAVYRYDMVNLAVNGETVLTERVDVISAGDREMPVPVMGTFEIRHGKIVQWRDYFDTGLLAKMHAGEDVSSLVP